MCCVCKKQKSRHVFDFFFIPRKLVTSLKNHERNSVVRNSNQVHVLSCFKYAF